jgi:hypothetical protein
MEVLRISATRASKKKERALRLAVELLSVHKFKEMRRNLHDGVVGAMINAEH